MSGYDKDRHSRMSASSVNQPMKKDGGGAANWGNPLDPSTTYDPKGHGVAKVITTAAPVTYTSQPMQPMAVSVSDPRHFPTLGGSTMISGGSVSTVAPTVYWGAGMSGAPAPAALQEQLATQNRQGVVYDASHPRNAFARQPRVSTAVAAESGQTQPALAIDWSQAGQQAIQQTMLHVAANPTVMLGPATTQGAYPAVPLDVLRAQPAPVPIQPRHIMQSYTSQPQFVKSPKILQSGRGR